MTKVNRDSVRWAAPEVLFPGVEGSGGDEDIYPVTAQSDVYSFGMTVLEVSRGSSDRTCICALMKGLRYIQRKLRSVTYIYMST